MSGADHNTILIALVFAACLCLFLLLSYKAPYRLFNSLLLLLILLLAFALLTSLFSDETGLSFVLFSGLFLFLLLLMVPVLLIWNGIVMMKRESGKLANVLSLLLGIVIGMGEISFAASVLSGIPYAATGFLEFLLPLFGASVLYFSVLLLAFVLYALVLPCLRQSGDFDTVLIHGCALIHGDQVSRILSNRLDLAIKLYHASGERSCLIVSGGQGDDETVSEAAAMRGYLIEHGVAAEKILAEDRSHSTEENLVFSKQAMDEHGCGKRIALVTSNYHIYRCVLRAHELNIRAVGFGAGVAAYYWPSAVIREFAAVYSRKPYWITATVGYAMTVLLPLLLIWIQ